jgi:hypothetical protein
MDHIADWEERAEFYNRIHWGTVCGNSNFNITTANVYYKSMKPIFGAVSWTTIENLTYARSQDFSDGQGLPILINSISCSVIENQLEKCNYSTSNNCTHKYDVIFTCSGFESLT